MSEGSLVQRGEVTARLKNAITVGVHRESEFYAQRSQLLGKILRFLAILITTIMAVCRAVTTMLRRVRGRSEIQNTVPSSTIVACRSRCRRRSTVSRRV